MTANPKIVSFYLLIKVIFVTLSFVILDFNPIILFKKTVNHLYNIGKFDII